VNRRLRDLVMSCSLLPALGALAILCVWIYLKSFCVWEERARSTSPDGRATVIVWAHGCPTTDTTLHARIYGPGERLWPRDGHHIFWSNWGEGAYGSSPIDAGIRFGWGTEGGEPCLMVENDVPIQETAATESPVQVFYRRYDRP
jgi:hypothetical protein